MTKRFGPWSRGGGVVARESRIGVLRTARESGDGAPSATLLALESAHEKLRVCAEEVSRRQYAAAERQMDEVPLADPYGHVMAARPDLSSALEDTRPLVTEVARRAYVPLLGLRPPRTKG